MPPTFTGDLAKVENPWYSFANLDEKRIGPSGDKSTPAIGSSGPCATLKNRPSGSSSSALAIAGTGTPNAAASLAE